MEGFLKKVQTDDFHLTADPDLATHALNAVQWDIYIVPLAERDGTAELIALPGENYLVAVT